LVNQNYSKGKTQYCSIDATAHYSYDWAQNVHVPHLDQQVSKIYYLSPCKVHLFGIQDEAVREQINYVLNEDEIIGKGPHQENKSYIDLRRVQNWPALCRNFGNSSNTSA
jgi:hypothetical protein